MKTVLMVAEKPSLAQSIARILSRGSMSSRKGLNGACSVHEYSGAFEGQPARFKMTSVCGHVMTLDFLGKYNKWDRVDPAELFSQAPTEKKEANPKLSMVKFLQVEGRGCDCIVLWLDCDKEGENICFEVLDAVLPVMKQTHSGEQTVFRARFSSITDTDICAAMARLGEPDHNEALSVDARQELDLRIGCAFTRFQTKYFQGKYGNLDSSLISFGPCQTPTLGFCVERHDKIQSFKPETYWVLQAKVDVDKDRSLLLDWDRVRVFDREVAQMFLNMTRLEEEAQVEATSRKEKAKQRPLALNTVEMLRVASSALGMGPQHAMQTAERLYTQGYISYPRTETTHYPESFDLKGPLRQQANHPYWADTVKRLLAEGLNRPRKGHDAGDHPPITPMKSATEAELGGEAWRLYEYITRHFIATVSHDCKYLQSSVSFRIGPERFTCTGKTVISPGFTEIMPWQSVPLEESLPTCQKGDTLAVAEVKLLEKQTSPPDYLTEAELITLMEKHGIGTDASIPVHINNICQRNYVVVESGRRLKPTNLGIVLVHGYYKIDAELVLPTIRSAVEKQLNLIAQGRADFRQVLGHTLDVFKRKFHYFVDSIAGMDELMEVSFSPLAATGKPLSRCGKCHRFMKYIQAKPSRLHCSHCDETYTLPQNGTIKLYKELRCPLDDFELVLWSSGSRGKSYPLCPYCSNHPPFRDMKKGAGCNECTHPGCQHSLSMLGVGQCVECESGVLVLDPTSGPKWRVACNRCSVVAHCFENAHRVRVSAETCAACEAALLDVDFNKAKSPLPGNGTQHTGCVFCDPIFQELRKDQGPRQQLPGPSNALGMAEGAPRQSGQTAEETPGFLDALLRDFPAPLSPESPLPWKVPGPVLTLEEAEGELAELALGFLSSRSAPPSLAACLAHEAVSQLLRSDLSEFRKLPEQEEDGDRAEEKAPVILLDAAGLARSLFNHLWQACGQWQQQVPPAARAPQRQWLVSAHAIRNARRRMEDRHVCLPAFNLLFGLEDSVERAYFAVFDGHGGADAARYASVHTHAVAARRPELATDPAEALRAAFRCTDEMFLRKARRERLQSGTTGVCALIAGNTLHVAWLGDSQVLLVQQGQAVKLMEPHRPERQDEKDRIEALGGFVSHMDCWRVNGTLAVSRAIGDVFQKPYVSGEADAASWGLTGSEDYLLLACDGFFDVVPHQEVAGLVRSHLVGPRGSGLRVAEELVAAARERGSHDNITVVVVFLRDPQDLLEPEPDTPRSS
ncbi:hypothetical protein MJG53_014670 [Ovis ammon polii x Ovis aries]|uniref:Uncharacterized protein n=1 Tax=Ovis ammon polii x Ovis aries TaxID=2918886 RepID=A0ACB9UI67_9CETA|nr:hypothetical protein MJG53_014670 [Ovis ammon polii x Ovis aries]